MCSLQRMSQLVFCASVRAQDVSRCDVTGASAESACCVLYESTHLLVSRGASSALEASLDPLKNDKLPTQIHVVVSVTVKRVDSSWCAQHIVDLQIDVLSTPTNDTSCHFPCEQVLCKLIAQSQHDWHPVISFTYQGSCSEVDRVEIRVSCSLQVHQRHLGACQILKWWRRKIVTHTFSHEKEIQSHKSNAL